MRSHRDSIPRPPARLHAAASPYPPAYTTPIDFFHDATYFNSKTTHTDFSWAVPDDAQ